MKHPALLCAAIIAVFPLTTISATEQGLQREVDRLQQQTVKLQNELAYLQQKLVEKKAEQPHPAKEKSTQAAPPRPNAQSSRVKPTGAQFHSASVVVHSLNDDPESLEFYPTALIAEGRVATYIAGTPVVSSPYLGSRPAFDGSDYVVAIPSINRDIRLMQQRRRLFRANQQIGYPNPSMPIIVLSGKVEPLASIGQSYLGTNSTDLTIGTGEFDTAAILNDKVEAYLSIGFEQGPAIINAQRTANSRVGFNMGFVNIGNLDQSPFYFTAGQLYAPFGRYSSSMVSAPLPMILGRTRTRPFILGYKSQSDTGPYAAVYGFSGDTTLSGRGVGGLNLGYVFGDARLSGEVGASGISSLDESSGMQFNGSVPDTTFGGFGSLTNGNENVRKVPAVDVHGYVRFDRYNLTGEWVGATSSFRTQDLSFNGTGAKPQAGQLEASVTFMAFDKPASIAVGYQWSRNALALNLPEQRINGVFNISIWKDTVESLEYRHDMDYGATQYANGAAPPDVVNANTLGTGKSADTVLAQIGVYF